MKEYPAVPPIPAGWQQPLYFDTTPIFDILNRESKGCTLTEIAALELCVEAFFFLTAFQPPPGSDYVEERATTPIQIKTFFWLNRTKPLLDYLDEYLTEVRRDGTPEQIRFLGERLDEPKHEDDIPKLLVNDDDDSDDVPKVETFPEPSEAITVIERIAQSHASTSVQYVAMQITIRALRYLIESGEAPEFMRYVDQMSKWVPAPDEP